MVLAFMAAQVVTVRAGIATADLIPGPPDASWQVYAPGTGPKTVADLFTSGSAQGFVDAYQKTWTLDQPSEGLVDRLEHYSSTFWASFWLGDSRSAANRNKKHTSVSDVPGLGTSAYEVIDPADAEGFLGYTLVFTQGDYLSVVAMAAKVTPDKATVMDQARRQAANIPVPTAEYDAFGHGILTTIVVIAIVAGVLSIVVSVIVLVVVLRRRRTRLAPAGLTFSPDRRYWWDGLAWQDAGMRMPPGAPLSPDASHWWDGTAWRPRPPS
jgi:hypothetical protein